MSPSMMPVWLIEHVNLSIMKRVIPQPKRLGLINHIASLNDHMTTLNDHITSLNDHITSLNDHIASLNDHMILPINYQFHCRR